VSKEEEALVSQATLSIFGPLLQSGLCL